MHFALLGDHPDGLDMARALVESGRHQLPAYSGPAAGLEMLRRWRIAAETSGDIEEILANPAIDAVIVASKPADRPAQLRRALQSERHVLCVHPADDSPDLAYEAAMMQGDTRMILLPLLAEALHPAVQRLAELLGSGKLVNDFRLLEMERWSPESVLLETDTPGQEPGIPGWDVLRLLGGEIIEIVGLAQAEELQPEEPLLLSGRFERGGLFQATFLARQAEMRWRLTVRTAADWIELRFPEGWPGPATLTWRDDHGLPHEETWEAWNPWLTLVEVFEDSLAAPASNAHGWQSVGSTSTNITAHPGLASRGLVAARLRLSWQDEVRCLELDDASRRSVERRRASTLEYQEATEEAGFKGTMTLVGCALLWSSLLLLLLSAWLPVLGWLILPVIGLFLILQLLRWVVPPRPELPARAVPDEGSQTAPAHVSRGQGPDAGV